MGATPSIPKQCMIPVTKKATEGGIGPCGSWGVSGMQGFRRDMEDSHRVMNAVQGLPASSFFAVFDGHSGDQVCAE
jgi:serine/threonine protein phosphatase PrpC